MTEKADNATLITLITCPPGEAERIARTLVEDRLAACVNIVPQVRSIYRWEGKITNDEESLLICKTTSARFAQLQEKVRKIHPYSCPEIVALDVKEGFSDYLNWVNRETQPSEV